MTFRNLVAYDLGSSAFHRYFDSEFLRALKSILIYDLLVWFFPGVPFKIPPGVLSQIFLVFFYEISPGNAFGISSAIPSEIPSGFFLRFLMEFLLLFHRTFLPESLQEFLFGFLKELIKD